MSRLPRTLHRGPWRYLRDRDVLHAAAVTLILLVLSLGLLWLAYLLYVWRVAAASPRQPSRRMVVLVFGRRLVDDRPEHDYRQRLERARQLQQQGLAEQLMLLGGRSGGRLSEAQAGLDWLRGQGLAPGCPVQLEQASIDSLENLRHARSLLRGESDGAAVLPPVALVTSRYHLARCLLLAGKLGFVAEPVAAESRLPCSWRYARLLLLEAGYVMWIDIGLRWARLIGHRRISARIR